MANTKKIDEKDLVFINQQWSDEERKTFSDFLKLRKKKKNVLKQEAKKDSARTSGSVG